MQSDLAGLLGLIYQKESENDYDRWNNGTRIRGSKPLTEMTVAEVLETQAKNLKLPEGRRFTAAGALQIIHSTLLEEVRKGTVALDDTFNAETQDKLSVSRMKVRGLDRWVSGEMSTEDFGTRLAMEWASLPVLKNTYRKGKAVSRGQGYYGGVSTNPTNVSLSADDFEAVLADPGTYDPSLHVSTSNGPNPGEIDWSLPEPGAKARYRAQFYRPGTGPERDYPWEGEVRRGNLALLPGGDPQAGPDALDVLPPPLTPADYATRGLGGGSDKGSPLNVGRFEMFSDAMADGFIVRGLREVVNTGGTPFDADFDPVAQAIADGLSGHMDYLGETRNRTQYDYRKGEIQNGARMAIRREAYDGWIAPFLGGVANPDTLLSLAIPGGVVATMGGRGAASGVRATLAATGATAAYETGMEIGRARLDPFSTQADSFMRIAGGVALEGLVNGVSLRYMTRQARRDIAKEFGEDLAAARGIGRTTTEVDLGGGVKGKVEMARPARKADGADSPHTLLLKRTGVSVQGDRIVIDPEVLLARMKNPDDLPPGVKTANELMEYEVARQASLERSARDRSFWRAEDGAIPLNGKGWSGPFASTDADGKIKVNTDRVSAAMEKGDPILLGDGVKRVTPIEVDPRAFKNAEEAAQFIEAAHQAAIKARDNDEFRELVGALFGGKANLEGMETPRTVAARQEAERKAHADAQVALEEWRQKNNQVLRDRKAKALSRLMDSPFKRIHRNALSGQTRDLVDRLAADGAFLRPADEAGLTVGPSVYARSKTWLGVVRGLWDKERELYAKYLGYTTNPGAADILASDFRFKKADGGQAMKMSEFRHRVSQAYITNARDPQAEVMEMVEHLRGAWGEYRTVAEEYGVISGQRLLSRQAENLKTRIDALPEDHPIRETLQKKLDEIGEAMKADREGPSEDYFTRVWKPATIRANKKAFIENVIKPWMRKQPFVWVWKPGSEELGEQIDEIKRSGNDINHERYQELRTAMAEALREERTSSRFEKIKTSTKPKDIDARAEQIYETIMQEAELSDLNTLRGSHRPTFGRHRQFDIPNSHLLKDGPLGNKIDDFIETDYLLLHRVYADRMGPAIEMSRSFASPVDGVNWEQGFADAIYAAREAENDAWVKSTKTVEGRIAQWGRVAERMGLDDAIIIPRKNMNASSRLAAYSGFYRRREIYADVDAADEFVIVHEVIHGLRDRGVFTKEEWSRLVAEGRKVWSKFGLDINPTYKGKGVKAQEEEGVTHLIEEYARLGGGREALEKINKAKVIAHSKIDAIILHARNMTQGTKAEAIEITDELIDLLDSVLDGRMGSRESKRFVRRETADAIALRHRKDMKDLHGDFAMMKGRVDDLDDTNVTADDIEEADPATKQIAELLGVQYADEVDKKIAASVEALNGKPFDGRGIKEEFSAHWAPIERDLLHLRDRVTNRVVRAPDRWDNRAATVLRDWANLAFMGMSGLSSLQDLGTVVMRHGFTRTFRSAFSELDDTAKAGVEEMRKAGGILDVMMGGALSRFAETGMDAVHGTKAERWLRTASNKYFLWNGLAPLTVRMKEIDAALRVSDMVERIHRVGYDGLPNEGDLAELARWGISKEDAIAIAKTQPISQIEGGGWLANTDQWGDEGLVRKFRAAIAQGNENTILMATAADKPIIVDGTFYLRRSPLVDKYAIRAGLQEQGEYWRIQSGLMTLPFQYWNYAIAAMNKIVVSGVDEPSANKLAGIAAMIGMGYMVTRVKTEDARWDAMNIEDRIAKVVDQSGITGVMLNYANLFQTASMGFAGINPLPFEPIKGRKKPSAMDAATSLAGAGPGVLRNFVEGTFGDSMGTFSWSLPTRNHIGLSWLWEAALDGVERRQAGMDLPK